MELRKSAPAEEEQEKLRAEFFRLYKPLHSRLEKYVSGTVGNKQDAHDILGQALVAAVQAFPRLRKREAFAGFLFAIAANTRKKYYRKLKKTMALNYVEAEQENVSEEASVRLDVLLLNQALEQLPGKQKDAVVLFEISGFSLKEIAAIQGSGLSAVKSRLVRGREKLRKILMDKESKRT